MSDVQHFINGKRSENATGGSSGRWGDVFNPATGERVRRVAFAGAGEVDAAVKAATAAFPAWAATPPLTRARVMFKFLELLHREHDALARMISEEHGKVFSDAHGEITRGLEVVEFACGIPHLIKGEMTEQVGRGIDSWSVRQSLGVCVGITPFNFPAMVPMWMFPMALACGNTFVLKPSERDPSVGYRIAELLLEAGLPPGVFNVVNGDKAAVDALLNHPDVAAVSFVGSTAIASYIYATAAQNGKRVQALGGAKNHMVVMPDADLDQATDALMGAAYGAAGERCMAVSVAVAVGGVGDKLMDRLVPRGARPQDRPGHRSRGRDGAAGYRDSIWSGCVPMSISASRRAPSSSSMAEASNCRATKTASSSAAACSTRSGPRCASTRRRSSARCCRWCARPISTDAVKLVNDHEYGNGVAIFTRDGDAAREFTNRIQIGMVGINVPIPVPMAFHSFGGWKRSLFGDMAVYGMEGVRYYTRLKTVTARWPDRHPLRRRIRDADDAVRSGAPARHRRPPRGRASRGEHQSIG